MTTEQLELYKLYNNLFIDVLDELLQTSNEFCVLFCQDLAIILNYIKEEEIDKPRLQSEAIKCLNKIELIESKFREYYNYSEDTEISERALLLNDIMGLIGIADDSEESYYIKNMHSEMVVIEVFNKMKKFLTKDIVALNLMAKRFESLREFAKESLKLPEFVEGCKRKRYMHEIDEFKALDILCENKIRKLNYIEKIINTEIKDATTEIEICDKLYEIENMVEKFSYVIRAMNSHCVEIV